MLLFLTIERNDHGSGTNTKARDEPAGVDDFDISRGRTLHGGANNCKDSSRHQTYLATKFACDLAGSQSTREAAALECCN